MILRFVDRWALRLTLAIACVLAVLGLANASPPPGVIGECDPPGGATWSREQRRTVRRLVLEHCNLRASWTTCRFVRLVAERESSWRPGVQHTDQYGLGLFGLSTKSHGNGRNLCDPLEALDVVLAIVERAVRLYGARTWLDVQNVFGGRGQCVSVCAAVSPLLGVLGLRCSIPIVCHAGVMPVRLREDFCRRASRHGFDCEGEVSL